MAQLQVYSAPWICSAEYWFLVVDGEERTISILQLVFLLIC